MSQLNRASAILMELTEHNDNQKALTIYKAQSALLNFSRFNF